MSKKKLLEFGLKEADAFQKNFKIIFDRLVRGYRSMMGKEPEGLDLLKVKMEAREKAIGTTKVVNQKGLTLDPDKPIMGGTQEGIETIKTKFDLKETQDAKLREEMKKLDDNMNFFQKEIDDFNLTKDDPMGDLEKIVKGEGDTGLPKQEAPQGVKTILEEELGVKLYGDETFDELMIIKNTGKHPRDMANGGRVGLRYGGDTMGGPNDKSQNTASDTGPGGGATETGPGATGDSIGGSDPVDMGFIGSGPTVNPNLGTKGPTLVGPGPTGDGPGPGYVMSTTPPPSLLDKAITTGRNILNNPYVRTLGLGAITAINPALGGKLRRGMMIKGMLDSALAESGSVLEDMTTGTDVTGQTTALYKDGGLASMFVEKR